MNFGEKTGFLEGWWMDKIIHIAGHIENCYLVQGDHDYLVDTGVSMTRKRIDAAFAQAGLKPADLEYIFITHYHADHTGNLADLKRESGARWRRSRGGALHPGETRGRGWARTSTTWAVSCASSQDPGSRATRSSKRSIVDISPGGRRHLGGVGAGGHRPARTYPRGIGLVDRANRRAFVGTSSPTTSAASAGPPSRPATPLRRSRHPCASWPPWTSTTCTPATARSSDRTRLPRRRLPREEVLKEHCAIPRSFVRIPYRGRMCTPGYSAWYRCPPRSAGPSIRVRRYAR